MSSNGSSNGARDGSGDMSPLAEDGTLLRAGFPYVKTVGARRITWYPIDIAIGDDKRVYSLARFDVGGLIRVVSYDDEDLGGIGGGWTWPVSIVRDADEVLYISDEGAHNITVLKPDGGVFVEIGAGMAEAVCGVFATGGQFEHVGTWRGGSDPHDRVLGFRRTG